MLIIHPKQKEFKEQIANLIDNKTLSVQDCIKMLFEGLKNNFEFSLN